jgi:transcriptional regulator with XRE-family HTH domain
VIFSFPEADLFTGPLCKAARAIIQVSRLKLAGRSGVDSNVIEMFERGLDTPDAGTLEKLRRTLEELGAVFIPEQGSNGAGVRLKFSSSVTDRLRTFVDEGGPASTDAVP